MAEIKEPRKVLPFAGLIYKKTAELNKVFQSLEDSVGSLLIKSDIIPFTHTSYYNKEMGENLLRQWCVFEKLLKPDAIVSLKHLTNDIEKKYLNEKSGRTINIDPGFISLNNLILASTKNYSHRIYLGKGIYGEITLIYKNRTFVSLEWTYPDYREPAAIEFFSKAREILKEKLSLDVK